MISHYVLTGFLGGAAIGLVTYSVQRKLLGVFALILSFAIGLFLLGIHPMLSMEHLCAQVAGVGAFFLGNAVGSLAKSFFKH